MTFLTEPELFQLTARIQPAARIRVLKKQGIAFKLDGEGRPIVAWASVNAVSGSTRKPNVGIDVEALRRLIEQKAAARKGRTVSFAKGSGAASELKAQRVRRAAKRSPDNS